MIKSNFFRSDGRRKQAKANKWEYLPGSRSILMLLNYSLGTVLFPWYIVQFVTSPNKFSPVTGLLTLLIRISNHLEYTNTATCSLFENLLSECCIIRKFHYSKVLLTERYFFFAPFTVIRLFCKFIVCVIIWRRHNDVREEARDCTKRRKKTKDRYFAN